MRVASRGSQLLPQAAAAPGCCDMLNIPGPGLKLFKQIDALQSCAAQLLLKAELPFLCSRVYGPAQPGAVARGSTASCRPR